MDELFSEIFQEVFSTSNLNTLWENHYSSLDQIQIETSFPLRVIKIQPGIFNLELYLTSSNGDYYKPLASIQSKYIILPNEFISIGNESDLMEFKLKPYKKEIDILMGVFSLTSLNEALKNKDIPDFKANALNFEHVVALDGTIQCFYKNESEATVLDDKPLAGFKVSTHPPMIFATNYSKQWFDTARNFRLLELYNQ